MHLSDWLQKTDGIAAGWECRINDVNEVRMINPAAELFIAVDLAGWVDAGHAYHTVDGGLSFLHTVEVRLGRDQNAAIRRLVEMGAGFMQVGNKDKSGKSR